MPLKKDRNGKAAIAGGNASSSEEASEESGDNSSPEVPELNIKERASRQTAGQTFSVREGKEKEDDDAFWGHEDFQDRSDDSDIEFGEEEVKSSNDSSDSDIDDSSEEVPAEEAAGAAEAEAQRRDDEQRKRQRPKIFVPGAKKMQKPAPQRLNRPPSGDDAPKTKRKFEPAPTDRARRTTTKHAAEELKERLAEREAEKGDVVKRPRQQAPKLTQMERLDQAKLTETKNIREFQARRADEEDTRRRARRGLQRKRNLGPRVRSVSRKANDGRVVNFVEFIGCGLPPLLSTPDTSGPLQRFAAPVKPKCAVTGLPALYRDPLTKLYYAHAAAFAKIRSQHRPDL